ncbi:hypothetical protein [Butyrivibrio sp. AE2032]|uniref:hypothetical protein n=1 Tax=Butyrivibrio sp. AE2032 TaxID=1458463 RepID=UPI0005517978|nr:hypothetical protein [Butyrivibrio sp. AE2032]
MEIAKRSMLCPVLILAVMLSGCFYDPDKLEAKNKAELEEKKAVVTEYMETCLNDKYADVLGGSSSDELFEVYDLSKGQNQAWFNRGTYPAKARCVLDGYDVEFDTEVYMESRIKSFGAFKDTFYAVLYGEEVKQSLEDMVSEYPLSDIDIHYLPSEDIVSEESELRKNLYVYGEFRVASDDELEELCGFIDKLNELGYVHRINICDDITGHRSMGKNNITSDEVRDFFEGN